jgi:hypothetical protein
VRLGIHDAERAVGKAVLAMRIGPAWFDSKLYDVLVGLGFLQQRPSSWSVPDEIASLPWGHSPVPAPDPDRPIGLEGN